MELLRTRRCDDCGDDIPYYSRICPFCHYHTREGGYDFDSSPYLMMRDLCGIGRELIELERITTLGGVGRWFSCQDIDPYSEQILSARVTFDVIYETILYRYGRFPVVCELLESVRDLTQDWLEERERKIRSVRNVARVVVLLLLLSIVVVGVALAL